MPKVQHCRTSQDESGAVGYESGEWRIREPEAPYVPVIYSGDGTAYAGTEIAYNDVTTPGSEVLTSISSGNFILMHLFGTNDVEHGSCWIVGRNEYLNVGAARDGLDAEIAQLSNLPFREFKHLYTFIIEGKATFTNTAGARFVQTATGGDYIDYRFSDSTALAIGEAVAPSDHGALGGLSDDDHPQYSQKANNLSDLTNAATARTNLNVFSVEETQDEIIGLVLGLGE